MIAPPFTALNTVARLSRAAPFPLVLRISSGKPKAPSRARSRSDVGFRGCRYVIIGHSERRQIFGETDDSVNQRIRRPFAIGLIPILCVGETPKREQKQTFSVLDKQAEKGLKNLLANELETLVIAYEPVWAIGTGKTATKEQAQTAHQFIRSLVSNLFPAGLAAAMRILYGGSVKPENISELMAMDDIDGALVGGASLNPESFGKIVCY